MDEKLIRKAQQGDQEAFGLIVRNYQQKVIGLAINIVHNREVADDLAQEIFLKVYLSLPKFKFESEFGTWLYQIAINHIRDYLRKYRKEKSDLRLDDLPEMRSPEVDFSLRLSEQQEEERKKELIRKKLEELPEKYRLILSLRDIQGLSYEEIGNILKISPGTVDSRLHRARRLLKKKLSPFLAQGGGLK